MYCTNCGKKILPKATFCKFCGEKITNSPAIITPNHLNFDNSYWNRSFNTRIARGNYFVGHIMSCFLFIIVAVVLGFIYGILGMDTSSDSFSEWFVSLFLIVFIWTNISLSVRRAHDLGKKSSYAIWLLVPLVNFIVGIDLLYGLGTDGANQFGNPPDKKISLTQIFAIK